MYASFNSNPYTTIVTCYSPTNASEVADITTFNNVQSSLLSNRNSPKIEWIENAPLAILISSEQFNSMLVLESSGENVLRFRAFNGAHSLLMTPKQAWS